MWTTEYRNRLRVACVVREFASGASAKEAAHKAGWGGRKNMYSAVQKYAGLTRADVRPETVKELLEQLEWERVALGLEAARRRRRTSSLTPKGRRRTRSSA